VFANFNAGNWIAFVGPMIGAAGLGFTATNYLAGRRERQRAARAKYPRVQAIISTTPYEDGWRSVHLHIVSAEDNDSRFPYERWHIKQATLLWPRRSFLALAEGGDCAIGVFDAGHPVRKIVGRPEGNPQRFALEFFIKLDDNQSATFKVIFAHERTAGRLTVKVTAFLGRQSWSN